MTIGIDISQLCYTGTGVGQYTYHLVKNLLRFKRKCSFKLFFASKNPWSNYQFLREFEKLGAKIYRFPIPMKLKKFIWLNHEWLPVNYLVGDTDFFIFSDFFRQPIKNSKGITIVHDLSWRVNPSWHDNQVIAAHQLKIERTIRYQDLVIVDSINTKKDLIKFYPVFIKRAVYVIYPGIDQKFRKINDEQKIKKVLKKYLGTDSLNKKFFLYVGAIEPRKNLEVVLTVFYKLHKLKKINPQTKLVITGKVGWKNEKVFTLIKKLNLTDKVILVGFVDDADLPFFYNRAILSFYLSSYEGFGFPPLESLACGTPVVAGDNSSMRETLNKQFLVNEKDTKQVFNKVVQFLARKPAIDEKKIKEKFCWRKTASQFFSIIEAYHKKVNKEKAIIQGDLY